MTNVTLSIAEDVYKRMKKHSEIKWSEFVRKVIQMRLDELESIGRRADKESVFTMLASEDVLRKEWDNKADERWNNV